MVGGMCAVDGVVGEGGLLFGAHRHSKARSGTGTASGDEPLPAARYVQEWRWTGPIGGRGRRAGAGYRKASPKCALASGRTGPKPDNKQQNGG